MRGLFGPHVYLAPGLSIVSAWQFVSFQLSKDRTLMLRRIQLLPLLTGIVMSFAIQIISRLVCSSIGASQETFVVTLASVALLSGVIDFK